MDAEELSLITACQQGNKVAYEKIYRKYSPKMFGVSLRYMSNKDEAEDVLQESFVKVFRYINKYTFIGSFEGWIRKIVVNTALNHLRDHARHKNHLEISDTMPETSDLSVDYDSFSVEYMLKALQKLPPGYRTVFNLYEIEGYSHNEISDLLNISVSTSKSQLLKAKRYLQTKLLNKDDLIE